MNNVTVADTPEARSAFEHHRTHIEAASKRYPVVVGEQGVVFYDPREFNPYVAGDLESTARRKS